jgi:hypothetical protein
MTCHFNVKFSLKLSIIIQKHEETIRIYLAFTMSPTLAVLLDILPHLSCKKFLLRGTISVFIHMTRECAIKDI